MYYIFGNAVYFYSDFDQKSYPAKVKDGNVTVDFNSPMKKHQDIKCFYSFDEITVFADGLVKKEKSAKK